MARPKKIFPMCATCGTKVKYGSTHCLKHMRHRPPIPLQERFWPYVQKTSTCWLWTYDHDSKGYGRAYVRLLPDGRKERTSAHRFSWEMANGPIPAEMMVLHRCDTVACVRPDHLFLGTGRDNLRDASAKCRSHFSKLSNDSVIEIRRLWATGTRTQQSIADEFEVALSTVWYIVHRKTHVLV